MAWARKVNNKLSKVSVCWLILFGNMVFIVHKIWIRSIIWSEEKKMIRETNKWNEWVLDRFISSSIFVCLWFYLCRRRTKKMIHKIGSIAVWQWQNKKKNEQCFYVSSIKISCSYICWAKKEKKNNTKIIHKFASR